MEIHQMDTWLPPFDSGRRISRVRTEVPMPQDTSHLDQSLHSLTWQSITENNKGQMLLGKFQP
jgi:hypothetical protein